MPDPTVPVAPASQAVQAAAIKELNQVLAAIGTVQSLPSGLPTPDRAVVLTGTVLPASPPPAGQAPPHPPVAVIQTALGNLTLTLTAAIQPGPVTVQIQPGTPPTAAVLVPAVASDSAAPAAAGVQTPPPAATAAEQAAITLPTVVATTLPTPPVAVGQVLVGNFIPAPLAAAKVETAIAVLPAAAVPPAVVQARSPLAADSLLLAQETASETAAPTVAPAVAPIRQVLLVLGITAPAAEGLDQAIVATPAATGGVSLPPLPQPAPTPAAAQPVPSLAPLQGPATPSSDAGTVPLSSLPLPVANTAPLVTPPATPPALIRPAPAALEADAPVALPGEASAPPSAPPATPLAAGPLPLVIANATPAASSPPPVAGASPFLATVIASTSAQQPVLAVPNGTIIISQPVDVKSGTTLSLQILTSAEATSLRPAVAAPSSQLTREAWPALQQTLVAASANPAALTALARFIPTLGADFAASFVAYLSEAGEKQATDRDIILQNLKLDEAAAPGLRSALGLLQGEALGKNPTSATLQSWQHVPVPLLTDQGLSLIQVYVHQQAEWRGEDGEKKNAAPATTRFLLEVHPSALGPVQLDGLLRKDMKKVQAAPDHLDLIVRSEALLPADEAAELHGLFINALAATGLTGRLSFQYGRENFVQPASGVGGQIEVQA